LAIIILAQVWGQLHPAPRWEHLNQIERFFSNLEFWTTQTNIFIFVFLLIFVISLHTKKVKVSSNLFIVMSSYMGITMMLFWFALIGTLSTSGAGTSTSNLYANNYKDPMVWFITCGLHLFSTLFCWIANIFHMKMNKNLISYKTWHKKWLFIGSIYPIFYLVTVLVHGYFQLQTNNQSIIGTLYTQGILSFPYFFFDYTAYDGWSTVCVSTGSILVMIFGFQYLFIFANNQIVNKGKNEFENVKFLNSRLTKTFQWLAIIFYLAVLGFAIYSLTLKEHYDFKNHKQDLAYIAFYILHWSLVIAMSGAIIYQKTLLLRNKTNYGIAPSLFIINFCLMFCLLSTYFLFIVVIGIQFADYFTIYPKQKLAK
jgi:hypothetical protein